MVGAEQTSLAGARVTVMGLARSGVAACRLLQEVGARVTVSDRKEPNELQAALGGIDRGAVEVTVGPNYEASLDAADHGGDGVDGAGALGLEEHGHGRILYPTGVRPFKVGAAPPGARPGDDQLPTASSQ